MGGLARTADSPPCTGGVHLSRLPPPVVRFLYLDRRDLDAEGRPELAHPRAHQVSVLSGSRRLSRPAADPAADADRRRHRRPARSETAAALFAVRADGDGADARIARLLGEGPDLADPRAVVRHRPRPGLR